MHWVILLGLERWKLVRRSRVRAIQVGRQVVRNHCLSNIANGLWEPIPNNNRVSFVCGCPPDPIRRHLISPLWRRLGRSLRPARLRLPRLPRLRDSASSATRQTAGPCRFRLTLLCEHSSGTWQGDFCSASQAVHSWQPGSAWTVAVVEPGFLEAYRNPDEQAHDLFDSPAAQQVQASQAGAEWMQIRVLRVGGRG